LYTDLNVTF